MVGQWRYSADIGTRAAWAGLVGDDPLGRRLVRQLAERGVDVRWVGSRTDAPTGVYFKDPGNGVRYYRAGSAASRMDPAFLESTPLDMARAVHLSGITPALSASCDALAEALVERPRDGSALVSFDVNHRPALWAQDAAAERLRSLAARSDLVFVGLDEAAALWGTETPAAVRALLPQPSLLVVKDTAAVAIEFSDAGVAEVPAFEVEVVEPVGAGDAFAAGYLHALLAGRSPAERLAAGHARAVTVLGETADFPRAERPITRSTQ